MTITQAITGTTILILGHILMNLIEPREDWKRKIYKIRLSTWIVCFSYLISLEITFVNMLLSLIGWSIFDLINQIWKNRSEKNWKISTENAITSFYALFTIFLVTSAG